MESMRGGEGVLGGWSESMIGEILLVSLGRKPS